MNTININKLVIHVIILSMAITPAFLLGGGDRNLFLIIIMMTMPILFIRKLGKINKEDILLIVFAFSILLIPILNQPDFVRFSTIFYSFMFIITFLTYKQYLLNNELPIELYKKIIIQILYAYFIVLVIQQFCVYLGLPIFNVNNYTSLEPWKLNSLSAEPSHTARIVALLFYSYIVIKEILSKKKYSIIENFKEDKFIIICFLWVILTSNSGTAYLFFLIILLKLLDIKNSILMIFFIIITLSILFKYEVTSFIRVIDVINATLTFNPQDIINADHSASIRIVPTLIILDKIDLSTLNGWFGNGIDYSSSFLYKLIPGVKEGFTAGGMIVLLFEYGFTSFIILVVYTLLTVCDKRDILTYLFWFFLLFNYNLNSQIFWLCMILLYTNKYYKRCYIK